MVDRVLLQLVCLTRLISPAQDTGGDLAQKILENAVISVTAGKLLHCPLEFLDLALRGLVIELAADRMQEVYASKCAGDDWIDRMSYFTQLDLSAASDVGEDIPFAEFSQRELDIIGMGSVVLQTVACSSQQTQRFVEVFLVFAPCILTTKLNRPTKKFPHQASRRVNTYPLGGNVVLESGLGVDGQFATLIDRTTESLIVSSSIFVIRVVFRIAVVC